MILRGWGRGKEERRSQLFVTVTKHLRKQPKRGKVYLGS
jgi:hypothetical protein